METARTGPAAALLFTLALAISLHAVLGAQTASTPGKSSPAWPAPPAQARIRFVRTIDPAAVKGPPSLVKKLWRVLVGSSDTDRMNQPYGIAIGADSKVYVADTFGGVIHAYDLAKSSYSAINVKGRSLIGVAAGAGRLLSPTRWQGR